MILPWRLLWLFAGIAVSVIAIGGCTGDTAELKHRIAQLEKRLSEQEANLKEVAGKLAQPTDFSADIQRIDDEQERMREIINNQVKPMNTKLEEFRQWAQETQQAGETTSKKLADLENSLGQVQRSLKGDLQSASNVKSSADVNRKKLRKVAQDVGRVEGAMNELRAKLLETNTKLNNLKTAVKDALPQWKERGVQETKAILGPLEKRLSVVESKIGNGPGTQQSTGPDKVRANQLSRRIQELEELIAMQKSSLLELGSKVHQIETVLAGQR